MSGTGFPSAQKEPCGSRYKGAPQHSGFALGGTEEPRLSPQSPRQGGPATEESRLIPSKRGRPTTTSFQTRDETKPLAGPEDARATPLMPRTQLQHLHPIAFL